MIKCICPFIPTHYRDTFWQYQDNMFTIKGDFSRWSQGDVSLSFVILTVRRAETVKTGKSCVYYFIWSVLEVLSCWKPIWNSFKLCLRLSFVHRQSGKRLLFPWKSPCRLWIIGGYKYPSTNPEDCSAQKAPIQTFNGSKWTCSNIFRHCRAG